MFADFTELIRLKTQISTLSSVSRKMGYDSDIVLLSQQSYGIFLTTIAVAAIVGYKFVH